MTDTQWIRFDRRDPKSFPAQDRDLVVETERGQTFSARFIAKSCDFSLKWALWGNQGAVIRWRYSDDHLGSRRNEVSQGGRESTGTA